MKFGDECLVPVKSKYMFTGGYGRCMLLSFVLSLLSLLLLLLFICAGLFSEMFVVICLFLMNTSCISRFLHHDERGDSICHDLTIAVGG